MAIADEGAADVEDVAWSYGMYLQRFWLNVNGNIPLLVSSKTFLIHVFLGEQAS